MHEISVCQSIVNAIEEKFPDQLENVREVHLQIGELSCVQPEFLQRVYSFIIADTALRDSRLTFERTEIVVACENCRQNFKVTDQIFKCPDCGESSSNIIQGNELLVNKVILEEYSYEEINQ